MGFIICVKNLRKRKYLNVLYWLHVAMILCCIFKVKKYIVEINWDSFYSLNVATVHLNFTYGL